MLIGCHHGRCHHGIYKATYALLACEARLGQLPTSGVAAQWPYNVLDWPIEQRWEECYKRLLALNISHDRICRVWPTFMDCSVRHLEHYLHWVPTHMERVIDERLAGPPLL